MNSHLQPNKISEQLESSIESGSESSTMQVDESSDSQSEGGAEFREVKMSHEFKSPPSPVQQPPNAVDTNFLELKISHSFVQEASHAPVNSEATVGCEYVPLASQGAAAGLPVNPLSVGNARNVQLRQA